MDEWRVRDRGATEHEPRAWQEANVTLPASRQRVASPAGWLQFAIGSLNADQALRNLELAVSLLQTMAADLGRIDAILNETLAAVNACWVHGEHAHPPPAELGQLLSRRLVSVDEIARHCRFHGRGLLDGQSGVVGVGIGVVFIRGGPGTVSSPASGYPVNIMGLPNRSSLVGGVPVHESWLREEQELFLAEGDQFVRYTPPKSGGVNEFLGRFQESVQRAGLDIDIGLTRERRLIVRHNQYGSQFKFKGLSRRTPLLSKRPGKLEWSRPGRDIQGTLAGEPAFGIGRMLLGYPDNALSSELAVVWRGEPLEDGHLARCYVVQNGIAFADSDRGAPSEVRISMPSFAADQLGRWVETRSGFASLADLRAGTWPEVMDALQMLFAVSSEVEEWLARVKGWIQRHQNRALGYLRRGSLGGEEPLLTNAMQAQEVERMAMTLKRLIQAAPPPGRSRSGPATMAKAAPRP
ncbi:MAG: hypothetical protein HY423_10225 [Candidatus Lambdaproteobacteria bacterium]|nr:hypothetical protein [Candidatus Lambdaproteobacteria bacterium]